MGKREYLSVAYELVALGVLAVFSFFLFSEGDSIEKTAENNFNNLVFIFSLIITVFVLLGSSISAIKVWNKSSLKSGEASSNGGFEKKLRAILYFSLGAVFAATFVKFWWNYVSF